MTVPHYNALRALRFGLVRGVRPPVDVPFYQYFFRRVELIAELRGAGLRVEHVDGYDAYKGIKDTIGGQGVLDRVRARGRRWRRAVDSPPRWVRRLAGHMLLVVAVKPGAESSGTKRAA